MATAILDWLLEDDNPSVRFATLTTLQHKPLKDSQVQEAKKSIGKADLVEKILARQNPDGSWGKPERFYSDKYTGTVWTLLLLSELYAPPEDPRIIQACEFILEHSYSKEGGFAYCEEYRTEKNLQCLVIPCLTGNMVFSLLRFGYLKEPRVQHSIDWLCKNQRTDDGEGKKDNNARYNACWGSHSCHMGVAKTFKALVEIPEASRSEQVSSKIGELADYFLKHHIYKKSHALEEVSIKSWLRFGFPLMYQSDVLELLGMFASLHLQDPRLEDAISLVEQKRTKEGLWVMENSYNGRMQVPIEKKGVPSKWLTLKALRVLQEYRKE
jgi:hypothetical protein